MVKSALKRKQSFSADRARDLTMKIEQVEKLFGQLDRMRTIDARSAKADGLLRDILNGFRSLLKEHRQDLESMRPESDGLDQRAIEALIDRLEKLSNYQTACDELLRAARRYSAFQRLTIEFVDLQQNDRLLSEKAVKNADALVDGSIPKALDKIAHQEQGKKKRIRTQAKTRLGDKCRLHAEMQLVLFYERNPGLIRPRVLCSSKRACYLCYLFINLHGGFFTPSTHGKLYHTWKWPGPISKASSKGSVTLERLLPAFSKSIDMKMIESLTTRIQIRRQISFESKIDVSSMMTPSVLSDDINLPNASLRVQEQMIVTQSGDLGATYNSAEYPQSATAGNTVNADASLTVADSTAQPPQLAAYEIDDQNPKFEDVPRPDSVLDDVPPAYAEAENPTEPDSLARNELHETSVTKREMQSFGSGNQNHLRLEKGQVARYTFTTNKLLQVSTPEMHLHFERDTFAPASMLDDGTAAEEKGNQQCTLQLSFEWLLVEPMQRDDASHAVELGGRWAEHTVPNGALFSADGLVLKHKATRVRIRAGRIED
ncbi:MAG: hypothetical protein M1820_004648 [Bogoriella megaspora]|nr:MAG: hypothetical protein M1820_004648 [Bogoriella megaspora]